MSILHGWPYGWRPADTKQQVGVILMVDLKVNSVYNPTGLRFTIHGLRCYAKTDGNTLGVKNQQPILYAFVFAGKKLI